MLLPRIRAIRSSLRNPVFRSTLIYLTSSGVNAAIPFFLLPVLTAYLTAEEYGVVSTFMVFNSVFLLVVGLEQQSFISVNFFSYPVETVKKFATNVIFLSFTVALVLLGVTLVLQGSTYSVSQISIKWIIWSVIVAFLQYLFQLNLVIWQLNNRAMWYGLFQILNSVVNYAVSIVLIIQFGLDDEGRILGITAAAIVFGFTSLIFLWKKGYLGLEIDLNIVKMSVLFSLPLVPHAFAGWINTAADRLIINHYSGVADNGIYAIGFQFSMVVTLVAGSFNKAFAPVIFKTLTGNVPNGKIRLVKYTYIYYAALITLTLLIGFATKGILKVLVDPEYYSAEKFVYWLLAGFMFDGLYYGVINYIYFSRRTILISAITFFSAIIHFVMSIVLIPRFGAMGAAYSTAASYALSFILASVVSQRVLPMPWLFQKGNRANIQ